ncbi:hypothetical protein ONZ45_g2501 [Pleurotus djamor]|nr:hypothetical protein ONZ45_g2501 [Pleurotus djamor]
MGSSRPSTAGDKSTIAAKDFSTGFFGRRKGPRSEDRDDPAEKASSDEIISAKTEDVVRPVSFIQMFRYSTPYELTLNAIGLVASTAAGAATPLMTLLFGNLVEAFVAFTMATQGALDGTTSQQDVESAAATLRTTAANNASYLVYIGLGMFVCTYIYMYTWVYTGEVNAKRIRERYLQAVLRQNIAWFDSTGAGEVTTRIQTDTHLVQQGISEKVALVVNFIASFITGFILAYIRSWRLALALSSILPCMAIAGGVMNVFITKYTQLSLKYVAEGGSFAEEVISTVRIAQAFGSQQILAGLYNRHIDKSREVDYKLSIVNGFAIAFFLFVIYSSYALAFSFGTTLINSGHANAGQVINVFLAILMSSISLAMLAPEMQAITNGCGAAAKLYATIDRVPDIDSADPGGLKPDHVDGEIVLEHVDGEIVLEHVDFNYPSRPTVPIVKDLSIRFRAGKTAALVGASGSGKSTVISLVERFYDPLAGVVKLDGVDTKTLNLQWLRSQIGLVSQEPTLFATSIKGNVAHGLINTPFANASEEEKFKLVKEACVKSNADAFINNLPMGYDTLVGERGFLLSGGQKQRIAIARAIVSDPRILLLDEATSALDTQSEGIVQDALDKASAGRTTITIAHRLSTIKNADIIYVMGDGLVLEQGTHDELIRADGAYARLVQAQKLRGHAEEQDLVSESADPTEPDRKEAAREDVSLGRNNTHHSVASERLKQRQSQGGSKQDDEDLGLAYLFYRMGMLNREGWSRYGLGFIAAIITGMVWPVLGIIYASGIDAFSEVDPSVRRFKGDRTALWFFVIAIISTLAMAVQNYMFPSAAAILTAKLRKLSFKAILRQDIEFFDKDEHSTGVLTSNLSENPQKINGLAGMTLGTIVQSLATLIGGFVIGLSFGWKLALVGIACTPLLVSSGYIRLRVVVLKDQQNKRAHESSAQLACEAAGSIRTVASLTRENDCLDIYRKSLDEPLHRSNRTAIWSNALFSFSQSAVFWVIALVFWYGSRLVSTQEYSTFQFFICLMSTTFGAIQAGAVFQFVPDMSSAKGAASDIIRLLDSTPEIDAQSPDGHSVDRNNSRGQIRFEDVHFRYPTRPGVRVLRGLSLTVEPGTYIALVGASGCGKSTTIQLIECFYNPLAGKIYLDDVNISDLNIKDYREQVALVSQEPTLYAGTVRFNILLGAIKPHSEVTQAELEEACRNANILEFIQSLPDGFNTQVGGKGSQLSGGQKQRIAIARALLRNPKVLLLDEATSALDSNSEKVVQAALDQAAKGRTTIAIAHRLSTIQNADCIYFIKEGRVSEYGTHGQLLSKKGDYYEYVQLQALSKH